MIFKRSPLPYTDAKLWPMITVSYSGSTSVKKIVKPAFRASWIRHQVKLAKKQHMDGINIDIEQDLSKASAKYFALTALVKETTDTFHEKIPGSQVKIEHI